jgi:uracil-DNA glycosylase family 4
MAGVDANSNEHRALQALLAYYDALGVDCALDSVPHDRFEESKRPPAPPLEPPSESAPLLRTAAAPLAADEVTAEAQRIAAGARDLEALAQSLAQFEALGIGRRARHFLFAQGEPGSPVMAMEAAPGEAEERSGAPFCGPEARLLEAMLQAIGVARSEAYLAYFAPWRSPGGQSPAPHVAEALTPFARRHIALARPRVLLLFGEVSRRVLDLDEPASKMQERRFDLILDGVEVAAFVAPGSLSSIVKSAALKRRAWKMLRTAAATPGLRGERGQN